MKQYKAFNAKEPVTNAIDSFSNPSADGAAVSAVAQAPYTAKEKSYDEMEKMMKGIAASVFNQQKQRIQGGRGGGYRGNGGRGGGGRGGGRFGNRGWKRDNGFQSGKFNQGGKEPEQSNNDEPPSKRAKGGGIHCFVCGKPGHVARDCRQRK
jgi:hypothetical protein